jgi:hypothetical protein
MTDKQIAKRVALREYRTPTWRVSSKGNLYRRLWDMTLTVFPRSRGSRCRWAWCIASPRGVRFSPGDYLSEEAAKRAVVEEVDVPGETA